MDRQTNAAPIIIRRKKGGAAHEPHGGAWKIAFADFATAMMAFFLVMWLINATTEQQRRGLADYFSPSIPVTRQSGGGDGAFGGREVIADDVAVNSGGGASADLSARQTQPQAADSAGAALGADPATESDSLDDLEQILRARSGESMALEQAMRHVVTRVTDEGLIVELFDLPGQSLFAEGSDSPEPVLRVLTDLLAEVFALVDNGVAIAGHLRSLPVVLADNPAWDLSVDRAQRMRQMLEAAGIAPARQRRVTGHADRQPVTRDPGALRNNRLEVVLLRDGREGNPAHWMR